MWNVRTVNSANDDGVPVSLSTTNFTPSSGFFIRSRTSRATRESALGGKFSLLEPILLDDDEVDQSY